MFMRNDYKHCLWQNIQDQASVPAYLFFGVLRASGTRSAPTEAERRPALASGLHFVPVGAKQTGTACLAPQRSGTKALQNRA